MLQLWLGRAGSGKTHAVQEALAERIRQGGTGLILLVPEQFSFESERTLFRQFGAADAARVQVLSFTRMAETVAWECGGVSGKPLTPVTRTLLMSRALESVQDRLTLYGRHAAHPDYVRAVLDTVSECKQYAITPHQLEQAAGNLPDGTLSHKLNELSLIIGAYEAMVADSYADPEDALTRLAEALPRSTFANGAAVFVDGFKGFTEQQMRVLRLLMRRAATLTVTLCTDTLAADDYALFAPVTRTAHRFIRLAEEDGVPIAAPRYLRENHRAVPALAALEERCFAPNALPFDGDPQGAVTLVAAPDRHTECRAVAREIRRCLREGWRCRDIAVVARNLDDYSGPLEAALEAADIPYYLDRRQDIRTHPLIALVQSALHCVTARFPAETVLQLMKTGLLGFSPTSVARFENYLYTWKLTGRTLRERFTAYPDGFVEQEEPEGLRRLADLQLIQRRLLRPLEELAQTLNAPTAGERFARALFAYLQAAKVPRMVRFQVRRMRAAGEPLAAEQTARMWERLTELLDAFGTALRTTVLPANRWEELLMLAASAADMGRIPQGLDTVQVGSAERMRFSAVRAVWILGANEGVFPAYPASTGLLTERDRRELADCGITLAAGGEHQAVEERLLAYLAAAAPSRRLYISYLTTTADGGHPLPPSALVETVKQVFPSVSESAPGDWPESHADALEQLAEQFHEDTVRRASLWRCFSALPSYADALDALQRAADGEDIRFRSTDTAARFFGDDLRLSATQVETFYQCRFRYFCRYGLQVKEPTAAELNGLEFGTLIHYVMQTVLPHYTDPTAVSHEQVTADTQAAVRLYFEERMGGADGKPASFIVTLERLTRIVDNLLWQVVRELRQSRFVPTDYELEIGPHGAVPSTVLQLPDGARVQVVGKIDRVDVFHSGDVAYLRVIDYKSGSSAPRFDLSEVVEGIHLQMLLYLFSLWDNGSGRYPGQITPAGVLYLPADLPYISVEKSVKGVDDTHGVLKMNGLLLDNAEVLDAMESGVAGLFIPAKLKKDGTTDPRSSVATLARFGHLKKQAETLLCRMAESLRAGDVRALPAKAANTLACEHCPYRAVCGYETGAPHRDIPRRNAADIWSELEADSAPESE